MSFAFMMGTVVGGVLGSKNWVIAHSLTSFMALIALVMVTRANPPPRRHATAQPEGVDRVLQASEYWGLIGMNIFIGTTFTGGIIAATLILVYQKGAKSWQVALFFACSAIFHALESFILLPATIKRFGNPFPAMSLTMGLSVIMRILLCFNFAYSDIVLLSVYLTAASAVVPIFMTATNIMSGQYANRYECMSV